MQEGWLARIAGRTEVGRRVLAFDWASTSLGPPDDWPLPLRAAVELALDTRFPSLVVWGPDLVEVYNDAYAEMIGGKHPAALGAPVAEVWSEIWHVIGPLFDHVRATGEPTWVDDQRLDIVRNGFLEECYFTYSYSPIFHEGRVAGVLDVAMETTSEVVNSRRLGFATDLAAALVDCDDPVEVRKRSLKLLGDAPFDVVGASLEPVAASPGASRRLRVLDDEWSEGRPVERLAIDVGGRHARHRLELALNPYRPFDAGYRRFVGLVADTIGAALDAAHRRRSELAEEREISGRLQQAMLEPAADFPTVAARYAPATARLAVGGDWYDVVDLPGGRRGLVVGDCVVHGLDAAIAMGQLRSATRALLMTGAGPAEVLTALDGFAQSVHGGAGTTVVCLVIDVGAGVVTYSAAGHPPPLLLTRDGVRWLDGGRGLPLAVIETVRPEATVRVDPGDTVVLYTDGLIERRREPIDEGLARLALRAGELAGQSVQEIADALVALAGDAAADDVALVVKRVPRR